MIVVKLWESLATLVDLQASLILLHYFRGAVGGGGGGKGHLFIANQN